MNIRFPLAVIAFIWVATTASTAENNAWSRIERYFQPPPGLELDLGSYRSPLLFANGTVCDRPERWNVRRNEIRSQWMALMGPWPELLKQPRLQFLHETNRFGIRHRRVRVPLADSLEGEGWYLLPPGSGPFPAVLVVYYEPETSVGLGKEPLRDFGLQLAQRGFVTLSIGTPGGNAWSPSLAGATCQPLSFHAYVAANLWRAMSKQPEVDAKRIGVTGHSYGGKWAMFAGALWEPFACVAVSDPGIVFDESRPNVNYWEPWYLGLDPQQPRKARGVPSVDNPRTGAYRSMVERGMDLHEIHALIAPRPFWVSGGSEDAADRWKALNHSRNVNRLLGLPQRVALTTRPNHAPTAESNARLCDFFDWALLTGAARKD